MTAAENVPEWLLREVQAVIIAAMDNDTDEIARALEHIGAEGKHAGMYAACFTWACAIGIMTGLDAAAEDPGVGIGVLATDGQPIERKDPAAVFAARFVAAVANQQNATAHALFDATMTSRTHHLRCIASLINILGAAARHKQAEVRRRE